MLYSVLKEKYDHINQQIDISKLQLCFDGFTSIARDALPESFLLSPVVLENLNLDLTFYCHKNTKWLANKLFHTFTSEYLQETYLFAPETASALTSKVISLATKLFSDDDIQPQHSEKDFIKFLCTKAYHLSSHHELLKDICLTNALFNRLHKNIRTVIQTMKKIQTAETTDENKTFVGGLDRVMIEAIIEFFQEQEDLKLISIREEIGHLSQSLKSAFTAKEIELLLIAIESLGKKLNQAQLIQHLLGAKKAAPQVYKEIDPDLAEYFFGSLKQIQQSAMQKTIVELVKRDYLFVIKNKGSFIQLKQASIELVKDIIADQISEQIITGYQIKKEVFRKILNYSCVIQAKIVESLNEIDLDLFYQFVSQEKETLSFDALGQSFVLLGTLPDETVLDFFQENLNPEGLSFLRKCICKGLAQKQTKERLNILGTLAKFEKNPGVRITAIQALGEMACKESIPILQHLYQTNPHNVPLHNAIHTATMQINLQ